MTVLTFVHDQASGPALGATPRHRPARAATLQLWLGGRSAGETRASREARRVDLRVDTKAPTWLARKPNTLEGRGAVVGHFVERVSIVVEVGFFGLEAGDGLRDGGPPMMRRLGCQGPLYGVRAVMRRHRDGAGQARGVARRARDPGDDDRHESERQEAQQPEHGGYVALRARHIEAKLHRTGRCRTGSARFRRAAVVRRGARKAQGHAVNMDTTPVH